MAVNTHNQAEIIQKQSNSDEKSIKALWDSVERMLFDWWLKEKRYTLRLPYHSSTLFRLKLGKIVSKKKNLNFRGFKVYNKGCGGNNWPFLYVCVDVCVWQKNFKLNAFTCVSMSFTLDLW